MLESRSDAGRRLGAVFRHERGAAVLAVPLGGVEVAVQIARRVNGLLEVLPFVAGSADVYFTPHVMEPLVGQRAIVVDDGTASLATLLAAISLARERGAPRVSLAVPVIRYADVRALHAACDHVACLLYAGAGATMAHCYREWTIPDQTTVHVLMRRAVEAGVASHRHGRC